MKKIICLFLSLVLMLGITACDSKVEPTSGIDEKIPGKMAIIMDVITCEAYKAYDTYESSKNSIKLETAFPIKQVEQKYGPENIIVVTWPEFFPLVSDLEEQRVSVINEIAQNPEIRVLIVDSILSSSKIDDFVEILREQRDDIFIVYIERKINHDNDSSSIPDADVDVASKANLILNFDHLEMYNTFPAQVKKLGAATLVAFFPEEYKEHNILRTKCHDVGLEYVAYDPSNWGISCGSSLNNFIQTTILPLVEKYGKNVVFIGLEPDRLFSMFEEFGTIFSAPYSNNSAGFEIHPLAIANMLDIDFTKYEEEYEYGTRFDSIIKEIRETLDEKNLLGRVSSLLVPSRLMFISAAAGYGVKWMKDEVPKEGIEINVLEQFMAGYIAKYTGIEVGATCTPLVENGVIYENYLLVFPDDYLVY